MTSQRDHVMEPVDVFAGVDEQADHDVARRCTDAAVLEPKFHNIRLMAQDILKFIEWNQGVVAVTTSIFNVLADPTRRRVVELLAQRPPRTGELAAEA